MRTRRKNQEIAHSCKNNNFSVTGANLDSASVAPALPVPDFAVVQLKKLASR